MGRFPLLPFLFLAGREYPFWRTIYHRNEHCENFIVFQKQSLSEFPVQIATFNCKFYPSLRFRSFAFSIRYFTDKAAWYRLFRQASAKLAQTDLEDLRIWSTNEYVSSLGNDVDDSKIFIAESNALR